MTPHTNPGPAVRLAIVLRAENDALAQGDAETAIRLLPEKEAAAAALHAALPGGQSDRAQAIQLQALADENRSRLALAIEVQATILEMVARAARTATPGPVNYRANGIQAASTGALAFSIRA
jgi:hypothetical protein